MASYVDMARAVLKGLARTPNEEQREPGTPMAIPLNAGVPAFGGEPDKPYTLARCIEAPKMTPEPDTPTSSPKGQAVELWRDGRRFFLVADEEDAQDAIRRFGAHSGEVWTSGELELVASIPDQDVRDEIEALKRRMDGCLSPGTARECVSAAEWQAQVLNQMFLEQGVTGQPGKITAGTVRHGERKTKGTAL
jgi:hypothetical protein